MYIALYGIIALIIILVLVPSIGMNVIFLIIGAAAVAAWFYRSKSIKENINKVSEEALHVVNLEKGGVFELRGVGDSYEDMTLNVLARHLYQEGDFYWYELECDKGSAEKVWVEVEDDDETQVSVVLKKGKLAEYGLTPPKLIQIDEAESGVVNGGYQYEDSGNAIFYRFCDDSRAEKFYYWDFVNGDKILSVEKWGDNDYEVFISQKMRPNQIRVLRNKD